VVFYYYYTDAYNLLYPEQDLNNRFHAEMIQERNYWLNRGRRLSDVQARGFFVRQPQYPEIHPEVKNHFQVIFDISDDNEEAIELECPICLDTIESTANLVKTCCKHLFCTRCIKKHIESSNKCPCCRGTINNLYVSNIELVSVLE
jgi:SWI/SNF-related matrix-associated actin-dependent regulator of chromatin subfamily A3